METSHPIRIGLAGAGHLGRFHIECLQRIDEFILVGFHDSDMSRAEEIRNKYNVAYFPSFEELLDKVDALCIVTPTITHHELALTAIEGGKHLFIEKPLTDNPVTSLELVRRLKEKNLVGRVGHVERYNPAFVAARKIGIHQPLFI